MNLHFKPILWLVGGIIVAFGLSLVVQIFRNTQLLQKLAVENTALIENNEWKNAENVFLTTENSVKNSLERGEMEKFINRLQAQSNVKGLLEFSLFNPKGVVTHSSDSKFLNKTLPPDVRAALQSKPERFERLTNDAFEIYSPQVVTTDCLRCHTTWKLGDNGGTLLCRFSTDSLTQSKQASATSMSKIKSSQITNGVVATIVIAGFFVVLAILVVRYQIAAPLAVVLEHLTGASNQVRASSSQISSASQTLAAGASEQAASLEETSASLEELSAMTRRNAENAREAKELANHARHAAESGATDIQRMSQAMDAIKEASNNIAKIIKSIDEIAFQTNILALNAAVEAARAGEAGMGFAVVAEEVRNLAQRSAQAARETAAKIEDSISKSDRGVQISLQVTKSFEEIMETVRKVDDLVVNIASASKEQSDGIGQVSIAVTEVDKVTQSNAANAEQSAAAALELNAQGDALQEALSKMMQLTAGGKAAAEIESESADAPSSLTISKKPNPAFAAEMRRTTVVPPITQGRNRGNERHPRMISPIQKLNCWEFKKCGREAGGVKTKELGICPAYPDHGHSCATLAGTLCGGKVQGSFAQKLSSCLSCPFYNSSNYDRQQTAAPATVTAAQQRRIPMEGDSKDF